MRNQKVGKPKSTLLVVVIGLIAGAIFILSLSDGDDTIADVQQRSDEVGTQIGDIAPDFTLSTATGDEVSLSDFRGRPVFVNFWASWCPFCVDELPDIQQVFEESEDLVVLGINRGESLDDAIRYIENEVLVDLTFTLLYDPDEVVSRVYIKTGMPVSYFIDRNGRIVDRKFGPMQLTEMREKVSKIVRSDSGDAREVRETMETEIMVTDGVRHTIPLDQIRQGCFSGKDCIPSIDNPKFESASDTDRWLDDDELVLGIVIEGEARAYPIQILDWHEIVNDDIRGNQIAITYCPLCGSGLAFERTLHGDVVEFGVSGKLHNSDLIMYDRKTETYWSQITGEGIVGELAGDRLTSVPLDTATWGGWKESHPGTRVLSRDTGYIRSYGTYPYGNYQTDARVIFPIENRDSRLHEKTRVQGILIGDDSKAYPIVLMSERKIINDEIGGTNIMVVYDPRSTAVRIFESAPDAIYSAHGDGFTDDKGTLYNFEGFSERGALSQLPGVNTFWFAWAAFHPDTDLLT